MNLQKVIVKAVRPKTKLTREGFQTQVQGTILSDAGMVADLLKQVPRVRVDKDGNCSVFGKGTPEIYVNGRKLTDKMNCKPYLQGCEERDGYHDSWCAV